MKDQNEQIKIVEVGPRDGLQNESKNFSVEERVELIQKLQAAGVQDLEAGSFVSPKAIPQMQSSEKVFEALRSQAEKLIFLVPNEKGLDRALEAGVKRIAVFSATSSSFTQKNIGMSVQESLQIFEAVCKRALESGLRIRGYISTAFGCPYEGPQKPSEAMRILERLLKMGCEEVSIGDTIGVAHPVQVKEVFSLVRKAKLSSRVAAHFHDTRGMAIVNIAKALEEDIRIFDSSIGGLGGCPYAPGSAGNVATEEVAWYLQGLGFETGLDLEKLLQTSEWLEGKIGKPLRSKLYLSRPKRLFYFDA